MSLGIYLNTSIIPANHTCVQSSRKSVKNGRRRRRRRRHSARLKRSDTEVRRQTNRARLHQETPTMVLTTHTCDLIQFKHHPTSLFLRSVTSQLRLVRHPLSSTGRRAQVCPREFSMVLPIATTVPIVTVAVTPSRHTARLRQCISKVISYSIESAITACADVSAIAPSSANFQR